MISSAGYQGGLFAGQIQSISVKGTIRVRPWNDEIGLYSAITQQMKSYRIIKTAGLTV